MKIFFDELDKVGFQDASRVGGLLTGEDSTDTLKKYWPKIYLDVVDGMAMGDKKVYLSKVVNRINLFILTKFGDTPVQDKWLGNGFIPSYYHNGFNTRELAGLARAIIRIRVQLTKDGKRISELTKKNKKSKKIKVVILLVNLRLG